MNLHIYMPVYINLFYSISTFISEMLGSVYIYTKDFNCRLEKLLTTYPFVAFHQNLIVIGSDFVVDSFPVDDSSCSEHCQI